MVRKDATNSKRSTVATLEEVLELVVPVLNLVSDPPEPQSLVNASKGSDGYRFWDAVDELMWALIYLPKPSKSLNARERRARIEAENVRLSCGTCELLFKDGATHSDVEVKIALLGLDVAIQRFRIMAS